MKLRYPVVFFSAILGAVAYVASAVLAYAWYPARFSPYDHWLSDLGNQVVNPQGAVYYNVGVMLTALILMAWFAGLRQLRLPHGDAHQRLLVITQLCGIAGALALFASALFPINHAMLHSLFSQASFALLGSAFGFSVAALRYQPYVSGASLLVGAAAGASPWLMFIFTGQCWLEWLIVGLWIAYILAVGNTRRAYAGPGHAFQPAPGFAS